MAENEEEEVTPEQTDLIVQYSAATGTEDLDVCTEILREHNWDLNLAVSTVIAPISAARIENEPDAVNIFPDNSSSDVSFGLLGEGIRRRNINQEIVELVAATDTNTAVIQPSFISRLLSAILSLSNLLVTSPISFAQNIYSLITQWWENLGPEITPIQQVSKFATNFNTKFDSQIPWLNCSYYSAVSSIRSNLRPIIVFISNEQKESENARFAHLLTLAQEEMKDRVQFWGIDIAYGEGRRTAETLFVNTYPCILIMGLKNNQQNCLYRTLSTSTSIDQLVTKIETAEAELVTARHELEIRHMDRRLREEQDLEFQKTMEVDRKRIEEEEKKKHYEVSRQKAAEEKENYRQRRVTEHRERRISAKLTLAPEPVDGVCILFKLPDGSRHTRKFLPDADVQELYHFVQSLDCSPGLYFLSAVFPTRKITFDMGVTINEFGIRNNEQLMVQEIQEYSDDTDESEE